MFDIKLTNHLAQLSKLSFSEEEINKISFEMEEIVELMDTVAEFTEFSDGSGPKPVDYQELREDISKSSFSRDDILKNAKERSETYFKVPKVV